MGPEGGWRGAAGPPPWIASGTFREIVPNEKLVMPWGWDRPDRYETLLTVLFAERDGGTELTLIHERFTSAEDLGATSTAGPRASSSWPGCSAARARSEGPGARAGPLTRGRSSTIIEL